MKGSDFDADQKALLQTSYYWLAGMIVVAVLSVAFLCCVICGYKSLKLAIDVIDASADFLACTKRVIFVPIFHFILSILLFSLWVGAFGCVVSMNDI